MYDFDIALIVTLEAESYDEALRMADNLAEGIGMTEEVSCSAVLDYERDNEGQRVLYLHSENELYTTADRIAMCDAELRI